MATLRLTASLKSIFVLLACCFISIRLESLGAETYDARISEKQILTPPPEAAPRINGPVVYGARPGNPFLYRIPTQGERPMRFEVDGLPKGLKLDTDKGIITGVTPLRKGAHAMTFTAKNSHGEISRPFQIIVGDKLALTPPTGWNSWGGQMIHVSDAIMRKAADMMVERGLADVGFQYVGIDDCWMRLTQEMYDNRKNWTVKKHSAYDHIATQTIGPIRDGEGNILPNGKFPDMKAMTDYIHSHGLKAGIYSSPGVKTCQEWAGSYGHESADADQYARWGFDLLKYDMCSGGAFMKRLRTRVPGFKVEDFWAPMSNYIRSQNRDILFNLCQYGQENPWTWAPGLGIQSWRTGGDLNHNVGNYFTNALRIATELRAYNKPGQWNDPDFMYIHRIRDVARMAEASVEIKLDTNQRYQYVTLWSMVCAPFFFSCDIETIDDFTVRLLGNADVLNINQDKLGHTAEVIRNDNTKETVMIKKLSDGSKALAVFNRDPANESPITVKWQDFGHEGEASVFDVWRQKALGKRADGISVRLSPNGVALFIIK
ncbi:MAG: putative Ig domain-containing protein [Akkermansiaceae bacterium]|jgi:alpha-galactosidase|nr:putative Ig domain-containing protein [Akkermansiaceae bacterium]